MDKKKIIKKVLEGSKKLTDVLLEQGLKTLLPNKVSSSDTRKVGKGTPRREERQGPKKPKPKPVKPQKKK